MLLKSGDLTAAAMAVDLTQIDSRPFTLRLKIWAKSLRNLAGQDVTYTERIITGYNAGAGAVVISQRDTILTHSTGTVSAITCAASGETITVAFTN